MKNLWKKKKLVQTVCKLTPTFPCDYVFHVFFSFVHCTRFMESVCSMISFFYVWAGLTKSDDIQSLALFIFAFRSPPFGLTTIISKCRFHFFLSFGRFKNRIIVFHFYFIFFGICLCVAGAHCFRCSHKIIDDDQRWVNISAIFNFNNKWNEMRLL